MGIPITWTPSNESLHQIHDDLIRRRETWPRVVIDSSHPSSPELLRALADWSLRVRAHYATGAQASHLLNAFYSLGAPLDLLTGGSYVVDESSHLLAANIHILSPMEPPGPLHMPQTFFSAKSRRLSPPAVLQRAIQLFGFNLAISRSIYEALSAITDHDSIASMTAAMVSSLEELTQFGDAATRWLASQMDAEELDLVRLSMPYLMRRYESLCHGNPARLDALAGDAIVIERSRGNLATLEPATIAAIFYDGLASSIFPFLARLGWDGLELWQSRHQRHYRSPQLGPVPVAVAAVGIDPN